MLSSQQTWSGKDGLFNYEDFGQILQLVLEQDENWTNETIHWWNRWVPTATIDLSNALPQRALWWQTWFNPCPKYWPEQFQSLWLSDDGEPVKAQVTKCHMKQATAEEQGTFLAVYLNRFINSVQSNWQEETPMGPPHCTNSQASQSSSLHSDRILTLSGSNQGCKDWQQHQGKALCLSELNYW